MKKLAGICYGGFFLAFTLQIWYALSIDLTFTTKEKIAIVAIQAILIIVGSLASMKNKNVEERKQEITFMQVFLFILYVGNLIYLLFFDRDFGRAGSGIEYTLLEYFDQSVNLQPFATVQLYIDAYQMNRLSWQNIIVNLIGNIIAFIPFSYFLPAIFKIQRNIFIFFITMLLMITGVEVLQVITQSGAGDIDDVILNMIGVILMYVVLKIPFFKKVVEIKDTYK